MCITVYMCLCIVIKSSFDGDRVNSLVIANSIPMATFSAQQ